MDSFRYLILGGGVVAGYAAQAFADRDVKSGEVAIISDDSVLPYERPPLSKDYLAGEQQKQEILISDPDFYAENGIQTFLKTHITEIDIDDKTLTAEDGRRFGYDKLLIATGSRIRKLDLPGADDEEIYYLRWLDDAKRIRQRYQTAERAVVIGGGFIGMETAAVLASKNVAVTWVFPGEYPLDELFTAEMARFFTRRYGEEGVTLIPNARVKSFERQDGELAVILDSGMTILAEMVLAGTGVEPAVELFEQKGFDIDGGITVNEYLETSIPDLYAAGDVTNYRDLIFDKHRHIEHWDNAVAQGKHAAQVMAGQREPFIHVPYFFSDEFDISWEFWGDTTDADQVVHRGNMDEGSFSTWWLKEDRLVAAFVMDRPDEERDAAQQWIRERKTLSAEDLANEEIALDKGSPIRES
jgi:NADPH-dependent 2,4-dienoyl-CoA reductase/sulfur reductase-like enzyme